MKTCGKCQETKIEEEFQKSSKSVDGLQGYCRLCQKNYHSEYSKKYKERIRAKSKLWKDSNPEYVERVKDKGKLKRLSQLPEEKFRINIRIYNLTVEDYNLMLEKQKGKCANPACEVMSKNERYKRLHIDHDHNCCNGPFSCGKCIRGLLCGKCNVSIGNMDDDIAKIIGLADYLSNFI